MGIKSILMHEQAHVSSIWTVQQCKESTSNGIRHNKRITLCFVLGERSTWSNFILKMQWQILPWHRRGFDRRTSLCWYVDIPVKKNHLGFYRSDDGDNLITDMLFRRQITLCLWLVNFTWLCLSRLQILRLNLLTNLCQYHFSGDVVTKTMC